MILTSPLHLPEFLKFCNKHALLIKFFKTVHKQMLQTKQITGLEAQGMAGCMLKGIRICHPKYATLAQDYFELKAIENQQIQEECCTLLHSA